MVGANTQRRNRVATTLQPAPVGPVEVNYFTFAEPPHELQLENGEKLGPITLAYETYGHPNADRTNAILILHALSGDAHVAGYHDADNIKPGWWDDAVGPGRMFDTDRYWVICSNVIGGCKGSTGPMSVNPQTGRPYGLSFPVVTIADMVNAQRYLVDHLQIDKLLAVIGGSMGGMQALQWASTYPERVRSCIPLAATARLSPQSIALNEVGRQAIYKDPHWNRGDYYDGPRPDEGLALARMIGHITYLSDTSMHRKFGRRLQTRARYGYDFSVEFEVESYLQHHGQNFIRRFDANSYLYITKAMDYFDLANGSGSLAHAFTNVSGVKFLVVSYTSDWLFPSYQSRQVVSALKANGADVTYCDIESDYGHDAFLLEMETMTQLVSDFLARICQEEGLSICAEPPSP
jgi:homoserine O-acetyltransferase/O-succinyltransferase